MVSFLSKRTEADIKGRAASGPIDIDGIKSHLCNQKVKSPIPGRTSDVYNDVSAARRARHMCSLVASLIEDSRAVL